MAMIYELGSIGKGLDMKKLIPFRPNLPQSTADYFKIEKQALEKFSYEDPELPFQCAFGNPVEEVLKTLQKSLDKTPRKIS